MISKVKLRVFLKLRRRRKIFLIQSLFLMPVFQGCIKYIPLKYLIKVLRLKTTNHTLGDGSYTLRDIAIIRDISWTVDTIASHFPRLPAACLSQAITAKIILRQYNIPTVLFLGVKNDKRQGLKAHAWLISGNLIITGNKHKSAFTSVSCFS